MSFELLSQIAEEETGRLLATFPPELQGEVKAVPVFFERLPEPSDLESGVVEEDTLGIYDVEPVPRIRLWLENIWDFAEEDEDVFREEVQTTVLHEIGHHLGWDEDDVADRGLG